MARPTATRTAEVERARVAAAVYGTVLVLAVLTYLSEDEDLGRGDIAAAMIGTGLAYFSAHVYVDFLAARLTGARERTFVLLRRVLREEWPLLQAMLVPAVPLVLSGLGVWSRSTGVDVATVVAFAELLGWGYAAGRRAQGTLMGGVISASVAGVLGLVVVELKNFLH
jgi:hypothetical protein